MVKYTYESNTVFIKDMKLACVVGINAKERSRKTTVIANITVWVSSMHAKDTDALVDTINYTDIYTKVKNLEKSTNHQLLETLADNIVKVCLEEPLALRVVVKLEKPGIHKGAKSAGIEVTALRNNEA